MHHWRKVYETDHRANLKKLDELAAGAARKREEYREHPDDDAINKAYWGGFRDGLLRAKNVLEGKG